MTTAPSKRPENRNRFWDKVSESLALGYFVKLTLSQPLHPAEDSKNVYARRTEIRNQPCLSLTRRFENRDESENLPLPEGEIRLREWADTRYLRADLFTLRESVRLLRNRGGKTTLRIGPALHADPPSPKHDASKHRFLALRGQPYLHTLGYTDSAGQLLATGRRKFLQVDRYVELLDGVLRRHPLPSDAHIVDVGSGKGALTFALYDYLTSALALSPTVVGLERREPLTRMGNDLARQCGYPGLSFETRDVFDQPPTRIDMLVALHACDTATDLALALGIRSRSEIILTAPCCHREVRAQLKGGAALAPLFKHGILAERMAEILTDGLRALVLEGYGYRADVFEFIATEHTPKNLMIAAVRSTPRPAALEEADALRRDFGIERFTLLDQLKG
ncbi:MAG: SAM-dependent methyltransferase [Kiritimatiellia bacterium]|nr:SAM-dependent methyltransferase [Kiritimatiellia bacterium]